MNFYDLLLSVTLGVIGYLATNFIIGPILECRKLRQEVYQKTIEFGNVWVTDGQQDLIDYTKEAAKSYRSLAAQLKAFSENLSHGRLYCIARMLLKNYDLEKVSGALFALEADTYKPDKNFRDAQVKIIRESFSIK